MHGYGSRIQPTEPWTSSARGRRRPAGQRKKHCSRCATKVAFMRFFFLFPFPLSFSSSSLYGRGRTTSPSDNGSPKKKMWSLCTSLPCPPYSSPTSQPRTSATPPPANTPDPFNHNQPFQTKTQPLHPPHPPTHHPVLPPNTPKTTMPKQSALRSRMDGPRIAAKQKPHVNPLDKAGYVLGGTVGVGAYAKVKMATNARSGQKVAVKIVCKRKAPEGYVILSALQTPLRIRIIPFASSCFMLVGLFCFWIRTCRCNIVLCC